MFMRRHAVKGSEQVRAIQAPKMTRFFDLAPDIISLGLGEPGFPTPASISVGGIRAIQAGQTGYPPSRGYPELRQEICDYLFRKFEYPYSPEEVLVTVGGSLGIDCILRAFLNPGDEVVVPTPSYGYYESIIRLSGGTVVPAPTYADCEWKLTAETLKKSISSRTKVIFLNYPNNPTGSTMEKEEFAALVDVIQETQAIIVSDEIYAELTYSGKHNSILSFPSIKERAFLVSGFSKSMAMTGWRIGYVCAPASLLEPVALVHSIAALCAPGIAQAAALEGLKNGREAIDNMLHEYRRLREYTLGRIQSLGWECNAPGGAFYLWPDIRSTGLDAECFAQRLRDEGRVAVVPGTVFGEAYQYHLRISYACSMEILEKAFDQIEAFCSVFSS